MSNMLFKIRLKLKNTPHTSVSQFSYISIEQ